MIKKVFYLLVVGILIYSGVQLAKPQYHYYAFKSDVEEMVEISIETRQDEMMEKIMAMVNQYQIPIEKNDINLSRKDGRYEVKTSWEETVNLFDVYQRTFKFYIDTSNPKNRHGINDVYRIG